MTQYREWSSTPVAWEVAKNTDPDVPTLAHRILRNIAHAHRWRTEYHRARDGTAPRPDPSSAPSPDPAEPLPERTP